MLPIALFDGHKVIILNQQGHSQREISRQTGFSRCRIKAVIEKFQISGHVEDKKGPKKLSVSYGQSLKVTSLRDRKNSNNDHAQHLADSSGSKVHSFTVWRSLIRNGLNKRLVPSKTFIRNGNREKRLKYLKAHCDWNKDQFRQVLWSGETKFELFWFNRRR